MNFDTMHVGQQVTCEGRKAKIEEIDSDDRSLLVRYEGGATEWFWECDDDFKGIHSDADDEFTLMRSITTQFEGLSADAARRVVSYLYARFA